MKKPLIIAAVELGTVTGIVVAAVVLPRSTPLRPFLIISAAALALGNALLFRALWRGGRTDGGVAARQGRRASQVSLLVMFVLLLLLFLVNRL